jgi:cobalt transporter subunit CbtA
MVASSRLLGNRVEKVDWRYGLAWGAAGYAVFWLAPALGLPPEIPLATAAPLEDRQWWWVLAAVFTATGLAGLAFLRSPLRWAMPFLLLVPHIIGAPHVDSALFADQAPEVAVQLESLAQQFIGASALVNALLWLVIGLVGVWALRRIVGANETGRDRMSSAA